MAWVGGIPRNPALVTRRDIDFAQIGDDLIHESLGCPKGRNGTGRGMGGLSDDDMAKSDWRFHHKHARLDVIPVDPIAAIIDTLGLTLGELTSVISEANLNERELSIVVRWNEGVDAWIIARDMGIPHDDVIAALKRSMAALQKAVSIFPYFGLRESYLDDLHRTRRRRVSHTRPNSKRTT